MKVELFWFKKKKNFWIALVHAEEMWSKWILSVDFLAFQIEFYNRHNKFGDYTTLYFKPFDYNVSHLGSFPLYPHRDADATIISCS